LRRISLFVPEPYLQGLNDLVRQRLYPHRAEAIRLAIRDLLLKEQTRQVLEEVIP